jgi:hypothetical protein
MLSCREDLVPLACDIRLDLDDGSNAFDPPGGGAVALQPVARARRLYRFVLGPGGREPRARPGVERHIALLTRKTIDQLASFRALRDHLITEARSHLAAGRTRKGRD